MTLDQAYKEYETTGNLFVGNNGVFEKKIKKEMLEKAIKALRKIFPNAEIRDFR